MTVRKTLFVILGILMILAGITCFFTPIETSSVIPFIFGLAMVIDGIGRIIAWFSIREYAPQSGWVLASSIISLVFGLMLFGEMVGSNWWVALILGLLLGVLGVIVILNPLLGLGVIGVVVGCGMITAGINLIFLSTNVWLW